MSTKWIFFQNNVIAGVPRPGPYYIYNYFLHAHPTLYTIDYLRIDSMILTKYQLDLFEITTILHLYDGRH